MNDNDAPDESNRPELRRKPGRPPIYVFNKPDSKLSENELRLKDSVIKRRLRQNRLYHRNKRFKKNAEQNTGGLSRYAGPLTQTAPNCGESEETGSSTQSVKPRSPEIMNIESRPKSALPNRDAWSSTDFVASSSKGVSDCPEHVGDAFGLIVEPPLGSEGHQETPSPHDTPISLDQIIKDSFGTTMTRHPREFVKTQTSHREELAQDLGELSSLPSSITPNDPPAGKDTRSHLHEHENQLLEEILDASDSMVLTHTKAHSNRIRCKNIFVDEASARLACLPKASIFALQRLLLFPTSFTAESAIYVMGTETYSEAYGGKSAILQSLVDAKFLMQLPSDRYIFIESAKRLVPTCSSLQLQPARERVVSHFLALLRYLEQRGTCFAADDCIDAMRTYDEEHGNMAVALQYCKELGERNTMLEFISSGATVMRYFICAEERIRIFEDAIRRDSHSFSARTSMVEQEYRVRLALAEAYFDNDLFDEGGKHLRHAIGIMASIDEGSLPITTSVLALLLFAELRVEKGEFDEASKLLAQASTSLHNSGLNNSTLSVHSLLTSASIHIRKGDLGLAMSSAKAALSLLTELGYSRMPIFADALGTLGSTHFQNGALDVAQDHFLLALRVIRNWRERKWDHAPLQHCLHLETFLVEVTADIFRAQNRCDEADQLFSQAHEGQAALKFSERWSGDGPIQTRMNRRVQQVTSRHLY